MRGPLLELVVGKPRGSDDLVGALFDFTVKADYSFWDKLLFFLNPQPYKLNCRLDLRIFDAIISPNSRTSIPSLGRKLA